MSKARDLADIEPSTLATDSEVAAAVLDKVTDAELAAAVAGLATEAYVDAAVGSAGSGLEFIATADISDVATVDFTAFDGTRYDAYMFVFQNVVPIVDGGILFMRTSGDGGLTWDVGANDYAWAYYSTADGGTSVGVASDTLDTEIQLSDAIGSVTTEPGYSGRLMVYGPHLAEHTIMTFEARYWRSNSFFYNMQGGGSRRTPAVVNGVRFYANSGNLGRGTITMYGMRNA